MLDRAALAAELRRAFTPRDAGGPPLLGAEVELLPVDADSGLPVPIHHAGGRATLPLLRRFAARHGWREVASPYGAPGFESADGAALSYEPGGQIELSAAPLASGSALVDALRATVLPLVDEAAGEGVTLLSLGIDPQNGIEDTELQLPGERYRRLTRFMQSVGTGGERMMRQTAAFQVSLDWSGDPARHWRLLNALAPWTLALFANSALYRGEPSGERSFRARVWRELDGGRTGIFRGGGDPVAEYLRFAVEAPALLLPGAEQGWPSFAECNARGAVSLADWKAHLTTLFPEVRPKGFVEVRSADAVAPEWYAAPLVFLAGLSYHAPAQAAALELVGEADPGLLDRAGRDGLNDPALSTVACDLTALALEGATALGKDYFHPRHLDEAREFFARYTARGRSPADDALERVAPHCTEMIAAD
jgi:glutamate--cysteine ligase